MKISNQPTSREKTLEKQRTIFFSKLKKKHLILKALKPQHWIMIAVLSLSAVGLVSAMVVSNIGQDIRQQAFVNVPYRVGDPCKPGAIDESEGICSPDKTKISCDQSGRWVKIGTCEETEKNTDKVAQKADPGGDEAGGIGENELCNSTEQCASGLACIDTPYGRYCLNENTAGCGNGRCESEFNETAQSCPRDCTPTSTSEPASRSIDQKCAIDADCQNGLACISQSCQNKLAIGSTCTTTAHCQDGLACSAGVCKELQNFNAGEGEPIYTQCQKSFESKNTRYEDERRRCMSGAPRVIWSDAVCGCISTDTPEGESAARIISNNQEELGYTEENGYGGFDANSTYSDFNRVGYCATQVRGTCEISRTNRNNCEGIFNPYDENSALTSCQSEVNLEIVSCVYYGTSPNDQNAQCNTLVDVPRAECNRVGGTIYTGSREEAVANCASNNNLEWCVLKTGNNCFSRQYDSETCRQQNGVRYGNQRPSYEDEQTLCRTIVVEEDQENRSGVCVERQNGVCIARDYIDIPESECVSNSTITRQFFPMDASMVQGSLGSVRTSVCEYYGLENTTVEEDLELGYCATYNSELGRCTNYQSYQITTNTACNEAGGYFAPQSSNTNPNDAIAACNSGNNIGGTCYYIENYGEPNCVFDTRSLSECNSLNGFSAINRPHPFDDCSEHINTLTQIEKNNRADVNNPLGYCAAPTTACVPVLLPYEVCSQNNGFWPSSRFANGLSTRDEVSRTIVQERCDESLNYREVQPPTVAVTVSSNTSTTAVPLTCRIPIVGAFLCNQSNSATRAVQSRNNTGIQLIDTFFNVLDSIFGSNEPEIFYDTRAGWCVTGIGTDQCSVNPNTEAGCPIVPGESELHQNEDYARQTICGEEPPVVEAEVTVEPTIDPNAIGWCVYVTTYNSCADIRMSYQECQEKPAEAEAAGYNGFAIWYDQEQAPPRICNSTDNFGNVTEGIPTIDDYTTVSGEGTFCQNFEELGDEQCIDVSNGRVDIVDDSLVGWCVIKPENRQGSEIEVRMCDSDVSNCNRARYCFSANDCYENYYCAY